ncbi:MULTISPECIES: TetR/AcrR family transcriptional regulator [Methylosinus]|uniref:TetR/AcrR family transcriptional regulator n=1 Tax=Methylosinus trichosporium (strain ATCC 35070 / NCIMB 11131 / UNIQEM 75 / OB3b) TaxID=595536 RepID=A0A2D2CVV9_METT3|nr:MULTISPECIES: TetR/AcrR family transcriptional regulator [Methylosinus]ATQ66779.1 TetR/AcrR family transcriptional regulator [Methylosinus trichosporium OB3b]OBS50387.1 transcriptional regulator [Methylosinus sp. 3S-1]
MTLEPRKSPVQARSAATVEALRIAAVQLLVADGLDRCTTTRIAERAGASVGTLYQYYPNRDALLAAALEEHLDGVAGAVERACRAQRGEGASAMASALVTSFLTAKLRDPRKSRALYGIAREHGGQALIARLRARATTAVAQMLASAPEPRFEDCSVTAAIAIGVLSGSAQSIMEGTAPQDFGARLEGELIRLLTGYFGARG